MLKIIGSCVAGVLCIIALTWIVQGNDFFMYKFFAPKMEDVRRQVFEETKSYNQGVIQELRTAQMDYIKASPEQKSMLASVIVHRYADFPVSRLPYDLQEFMLKLQSGEIK